MYQFANSLNKFIATLVVCLDTDWDCKTYFLTNETLDYELNVVNALWVNDNFKVYPEYADTVNIHYDSIIDSFNASPLIKSTNGQTINKNGKYLK